MNLGLQDYDMSNFTGNEGPMVLDNTYMGWGLSFEIA